jgi:uncharacterized protein
MSAGAPDVSDRGVSNALPGVEEWRAIAPFESRYNGPDWLTGGAFGPEDSVITIGIVVACLSALFYWARRQNRIVTMAKS